MTVSIGLDIGGTKIAGAAFDAEGHQLALEVMPVPPSYGELIEGCRTIVELLDDKAGRAGSIGACSPFADDQANANIPILIGRDLPQDLQSLLGRKVAFGNDANCAALAEAVQGAGRGHAGMFGLIIGTGVGGGFIMNGKIWAGANGLAGEIGHVPLPYYEDDDGEKIKCGCGQTGCVEKLAAGAALSRLYKAMTGKTGDARSIAALARQGDGDALRTLDRYYTVVAKAMVVVLHTFDPDIITVSGGLNALPGLYDEVPKRWGHYSFVKKPKTRFVAAACGPMAGLQGAAILARQAA